MSETPKKKSVKFNLPSEVLPSEYEDKVGLLNRAPEVNILEVEPSMREVMYALDDEEYVEDDLDDFFDALDADEVPEDLLQQLVMDDVDPRKQGRGGMAGGEDDEEYPEDGEGEEGWYADFKKFKSQDGRYSDEEYDDEDDFDDDDRYAGYDAKTNFSMTSSALFRNKHLTLLDEQFDKVLEDYDDENLGELDGDDPEVRGQDSIAQKQIDKIFDEFLDTTEVIGRRRQHLVHKIDETNHIETIRAELREVLKITPDMEYEVENMPGGEELDEQLEREVLQSQKEPKEARWDVETVLTTYSNIYNHPAMIRDLRATAPKIRFSKGMPKVVNDKPVKEEEEQEDDEEEDDGTPSM
jgi:protein LTV1